MSEQPIFTDYLTRLACDRESRLRSVWRMTPAQRIAAMRRGELTIEQCCAWAARRPEQVPLLNGEFEFLAARTLEVCE